MIGRDASTKYDVCFSSQLLDKMLLNFAAQDVNAKTLGAE